MPLRDGYRLISTVGRKIFGAGPVVIGFYPPGEADMAEVYVADAENGGVAAALWNITDGQPSAVARALLWSWRSRPEYGQSFQAWLSTKQLRNGFCVELATGGTVVCGTIIVNYYKREPGLKYKLVGSTSRFAAAAKLIGLPKLPVDAVEFVFSHEYDAAATARNWEILPEGSANTVDNALANLDSPIYEPPARAVVMHPDFATGSTSFTVNNGAADSVVMNAYRAEKAGGYRVISSLSVVAAAAESRPVSIPADCDAVEVQLGHCETFSTSEWSWRLYETGSLDRPVYTAQNASAAGETPNQPPIPFWLHPDATRNGLTLLFGATGGSVVVNFLKWIQSAEAKKTAAEPVGEEELPCDALPPAPCDSDPEDRSSDSDLCASFGPVWLSTR